MEDLAIPTMPGMATHAQKIFFVAPAEEQCPLPGAGGASRRHRPRTISDETIQLTGAKARECPKPLRRIIYQDPKTGKIYVFLTNHFRLVAKTIADIYKERWQIEIFFRWIKQNLKIKAFIGNSENTVMSQIYAALIVYLLLCYTKFLCNLAYFTELHACLAAQPVRLLLAELNPPGPPKDVLTHWRRHQPGRPPHSCIHPGGR